MTREPVLLTSCLERGEVEEEERGGRGREFGRWELDMPSPVTFNSVTITLILSVAAFTSHTSHRTSSHVVATHQRSYLLP